MDDTSQPGPPLDEAELIKRIKRSMAQAERGQTVAGEDVLAAAEAFHERHFGKPSLNTPHKAALSKR